MLVLHPAFPNSKLGTAVGRIRAGGSPVFCTVLYIGVWKIIMLKATSLIVAGRGVGLAPQESVPVIISIQLFRGKRDHALKEIFHGEALRKCCLVLLYGRIPVSFYFKVKIILPIQGLTCFTSPMQKRLTNIQQIKVLCVCIPI